MKKVTLSVVANSLYPHQNDIDFIMCLRFALKDTSSLAYDGTTLLASSSIINAQIINFKSYIDHMDTSASIFRLGFLNYFTNDLTTDHVGTYIPTLLRIGGRL